MDPSDSDIDRLAALAALRLTDEERSAACRDLERIIALVNDMQAIDTSEAAPLSHPLDANQRLRADQISESVDRARYQSSAPEARDGLYLVPKVIE